MRLILAGTRSKRVLLTKIRQADGSDDGPGRLAHRSARRHRTDDSPFLPGLD